MPCSIDSNINLTSFTSKYAQAIHTFNCLKESNNNKRTNEEKEDENDINLKLEREPSEHNTRNQKDQASKTN